MQTWNATGKMAV